MGWRAANAREVIVPATATRRVGDAAALYKEAWALLADKDKSAEAKIAETAVEPGMPFSPEQIKALESLNDVMLKLVLATVEQRADFGPQAPIRPESKDDPFLDVPLYLRLSGRLLVADARRLFKAGEQTKAVERIESAMRVVQHAGQVGRLECALAGPPIVEGVVAVIPEWIGLNVLTPESRKRLTDAFKPILESDPYGFAASIKTEPISPDVIVTEGKFKKPFPEPGKDPRFDKLLERFGKVREDLLAAWNTPGAEVTKKVEKVEQAADDGKYGIFGKGFVAPFKRALGDMNKLHIDKVRNLIQKLK